MARNELHTNAKALVAPGKGILAADESTSTIGKRFQKIGVENTEENRRQYRQMLFATDAIGDHISGVILYDETLRQKADDGAPFPDLLRKHGVIPGIKVDTGAKDLPLSPGEKITEGLDGLRERLKEYHGLGARFAKWRAVITIGKDIPTERCLHANAHALARYAALCQEAGIVPIVEPEVLMDGDHTLERCYEVTVRAQERLFAELSLAGVDFGGLLLKPNMVIAGEKAAKQATPEQVAEWTLRNLYRTVPAAVPGIVFLSGGQSDEAATHHLQLMNERGPHPWALSFSYGRALQAAALKTWGGRKENLPAGRKAFAHRARLNGAAAKGAYRPEMEKAA